MHGQPSQFTEELEEPQELDGESSPAVKCFGWILKTQKGSSK